MKGSLRRRRSSEEPKEVQEQLATVRAERCGPRSRQDCPGGAGGWRSGVEAGVTGRCGGCSQRKDLEGDGRNPRISWGAGGWGEDGPSSRWRQGGLRRKLCLKTGGRRERQS